MEGREVGPPLSLLLFEFAVEALDAILRAATFVATSGVVVPQLIPEVTHL
jgi:hypothetical protein